MSEGHRVAVYYQTQYDRNQPANSAFGHYVSPLPLLTVLTHLFLAAFHLNGDRSVHLNDNLPEDPMFDQMWTDLGHMQSSGVKVIGMLGGAAPGSYSVLTSDFNTFYPLLAGYVRRFKLDGLDLDVEQDTPLSTIVTLINKLKADFGDNFIITLAPVASALRGGGNLSGFKYLDLEAAVGPKINWYNAQFYSGFGSLFPDTQYINIVDTFAGGLDPNRLVASVLTSPSNGGGFVSVANCVSSLKDLSAKYGHNLGGINGWEYFNSLPNGTAAPWAWAETMAKAMNEMKQAKKEFAAAEAAVKRSRIYALPKVQSNL
ncbi:endo-beta-N-acetylglucosaminidase [Mycena rebaudengoi]|nr:endo-beta-N-acetylglucosaminidase [Mycena rebaudengoi]